MSGGTEPEAERFGLDDEALAKHETVYRPDLFTGRTVLITGAAGGIGRAASWLFGRLGARLILNGRNAEKLDALAAALSAKGIAAQAHAASIRDPEAVAALFERASAGGGIDILVNNAGGQFPQAAIDYSVKGWNAVIDTNLSGTWHMMQAAARRWRDAGRPGSIVNIVVVYQHGLYGVAHTVAARAGVAALSRSLAVEWAPLGIRVNCVAPGTIETPGWKHYAPEVRARYPKGNPMLRAGTSWEIAEAVAYLAGPSGAYITGEMLTVDGGGQLWGETWTIPRPDYFNG
jgi:citronellol/citronellal dehydrogenase